MGDAPGLAEMEVGDKACDEVNGDTETTNERIYATCYEKVKITFDEGKVGALLRGNKWKIFAATRSESKAEDEYLEQKGWASKSTS